MTAITFNTREKETGFWKRDKNGKLGFEENEIKTG